MKKILPQNDTSFVRSIILMTVLYAWLTLIAGVLGVFYPLAIFGIWIIICVIMYLTNILSFTLPSRTLRLYMVISLIFIGSVLYFTVPTIFAGRDQGSLATAAIQLAQQHTLISYSPESTAFFEIYGRGKALNFPGFHYTPDGGLLTQFPLPYITFIAGFYDLCGTTGFFLANGILLFVFLLAIVHCARMFLDRTFTGIFFILLLTSFTIGWFAKYTLSENITGAFLWSSIALFLALRDQPDRLSYITFLLTTTLLLFTRIEGIWFFVILVGLTSITPAIRSFMSRDLWHYVFFPAGVLFTIAFAVAIMNQPFFVTMANALFDAANGSSATTLPLTEKYLYLIYVYGMYGLLVPLLGTICVLFLSIYYKKYRPILIIAVIVAPLFFYYFFPQISGDHPWMLRRYVFALVPATILITVFGIAQIHTTTHAKRILVYCICTLVLITNLPATMLFFTYAENTSLVRQTQMLSRIFGPQDLILIDQNAAGNGWSMITTPLRELGHYHAVYFFNPHDLAQLDLSQFDRTFLITPHKNTDRYHAVFSEKMHPITPYYLSVEQLHLDKNKDLPLQFPSKNTEIISGIIYQIY